MIRDRAFQLKVSIVVFHFVFCALVLTKTPFPHGVKKTPEPDHKRSERQSYLRDMAKAITTLQVALSVKVDEEATRRFPSGKKNDPNMEIRHSFLTDVTTKTGSKENVALSFVFLHQNIQATTALLQGQLDTCMRTCGEKLAREQAQPKKKGWSLTGMKHKNTVRMAGEIPPAEQNARIKLSAAQDAARILKEDLDANLVAAQQLGSPEENPLPLRELLNSHKIESKFFHSEALSLHLGQTEKLSAEAQQDLRVLKMGIWRIQIVLLIQVDGSRHPVFDWSQIRVALTVGDTLFDWNPTSLIFPRDFHESEFLTLADITRNPQAVQTRRTILVPLRLGGDRFLRQEEITYFCIMVANYNKQHFFCASQSSQLQDTYARDSVDFVAETLSKVESMKVARTRVEGESEVPSSIRIEDFFPEKIQQILKRALYDRTGAQLARRETVSLHTTEAKMEVRPGAHMGVTPIDPATLDASEKTFYVDLEPAKGSSSSVRVNLPSHAHVDALFGDHADSTSVDIGLLDFVDQQAFRTVDRLFWIRFLWSLHGGHAGDGADDSISDHDAMYMPHHIAALGSRSEWDGDSVLRSFNCPFGVPVADAAALRAQFEQGDMLGRGGSAIAYRCTYKPTGEQFCLKIINKQEFTMGEASQLRMLEREVAAMMLIRHQRIVRLHHYWESPSELFLVMQLAEGGTVESLAAEQDGKAPLSEARCKQITRQLLESLEHLHSRGLMHREYVLPLPPLPPASLSLFQTTLTLGSVASSPRMCYLTGMAMCCWPTLDWRKISVFLTTTKDYSLESRSTENRRSAHR
jgi:Protein kinase domain